MEQLKALLILKKDLEELKAKKTLFPRFSFIDDKIILLCEAIAELEALPCFENESHFCEHCSEIKTPKSCDGCKGDGKLHYNGCFNCFDFSKYEPKDTL